MSEKEMALFQAKARTFSLAARFFPSDLREGASQIYYWCRYADDVVDEKKGSVEELRAKTLQIWQDPEAVREAPFSVLKRVAEKFSLPRDYPLELIKGMEMDATNNRYETLQELELYCYRVASTVGLMMCHVMGVFNSTALGEAVALGKAMQMTNIARDVKEDFFMGRMYLPQNWLREEGINPDTAWEEIDRTKLFSVTSRLIQESEKHYIRGLSGIIYLPFRAAIAVTMASFMYREIGRRILAKGEVALEERTVVPRSRKVWLALIAIGTVLMSLPLRLRRRKFVNLNTVWRHS